MAEPVELPPAPPPASPAGPGWAGIQTAGPAAHSLHILCCFLGSKRS